MYDLLIVGAGLTAATLCASLKHKLRICVIDIRQHFGGNCYDYKSNDTFIHRYGPHIFHTDNPVVVAFLSQFTSWTPYKHTVTAEIDHHGSLCYVPFPYSQQTKEKLGYDLTEEQVINLFFRDYSYKMWGMKFEDLPASVRARVPKDTKEISDYFPGQFQALPTAGYTAMIGRMFDGVEMLLGVPPDFWYSLEDKTRLIIYTGRVDHLHVRGRNSTYSEFLNARLNYRSLRFFQEIDSWDHSSVALNHCHSRTGLTRSVNYRKLYTGKSTNLDPIVHEVSYAPTHDDPTPFYPMPTAEDRKAFTMIRDAITADRPNLILAGRLGLHVYVDMHQAVAHALGLVRRIELLLNDPG